MGCLIRTLRWPLIVISAIGCGDDAGGTPPSGEESPTSMTTMTETPAATTMQEGSDNAPSMDTRAEPPRAEPESNFGTIELETMFPEDPTTVRGTSGGTVNASTLDEACKGWVGRRPDHILVAKDTFAYLRIVLRSDEDATLVIKKTDGTFLCDDDSGGDRNPMLEGKFEEGRYELFVGSIGEGRNTAYTLGFSELRSTNSGTLE